jgi:hypothetical protein
MKGKLKERVAQLVQTLGRIANVLSMHGDRLDELEKIVNKLVDKEFQLQSNLKSAPAIVLEQGGRINGDGDAD